MTVAPACGQPSSTASTRSSPSTQRDQRVVSYQQRSASGTVPSNHSVTRTARMRWDSARCAPGGSRLSPQSDDRQPSRGAGALPRDLLQGVRASRRPRRDRRSEGGSDARHGGPQAGGVALRARDAADVPQQLGARRRARAARAVGASGRRLQDPRHAAHLRPVRDRLDRQQRDVGRLSESDRRVRLHAAAAARTRRAAHGPRARGRAHPLRPHALPDRAADPAAAPAAVSPSHWRSPRWRSGRCCSSGTAPRS